MRNKSLVRRFAAPIAACAALTLCVSTAPPAVADGPSPVENIVGSLPPLPKLRPADPFYTPPKRLPAGKPGDVIKERTIFSPLFANATVQQMMYLSKNARGKIVPVTGTLLTPRISPLGQAADADKPMVTLTPGTRGLGDHCAPSQFFNLQTIDPRQPDYETASYQQYLLRGISVAITDYLGAGTPLEQEYLVGPSEGQNGLDMARAAQRLNSDDELTTESPVGISGYSQGAQAGGWAAELQPSYAPELNLKGALLDAPPVDMNAQIQHLNANPTGGAGVALAAVTGLDAAYPGLRLSEHVTPFGEKAFARVRESCILEELGGFGTISIGDVTDPDVTTLPAVQTALDRSELGLKKPDVPAYIYAGSSDTIVPPDFAKKLHTRWCAKGADTTYTSLPGQEHLSGNITGTPQAISWMADRLAGKPAEAGCHEGEQLPGIG